MSRLTKEALLKAYAEGKRDFSGKDLSGLWLTLGDYSGCNFSNCDLRGTNFAKSVLWNCKFDGAYICGTNFDYTDVDGSTFTNAKANWKTSFKHMYTGSAKLPKIPKASIDMSKPIIQGDITTVSEEVWAKEWRVHAPDKENVLSFGGSFIGDLFDVNPFACGLESINEKKGIFAREKKNPNTASFNAGHRYEPYVAQQFVEYMRAQGHTVELITDTNMYQHPLHPYILCDMDYLVIVDGELCILECKTCSHNRYEEIANLKARILNKAYFLQTNTYLSVGYLLAKITTCYVCDCWGFRATDDDMAVIKVTRNEEFEKELFVMLDAMYEAIKNEEEIDVSGFNPLMLSDYYRRFYGIPEEEDKVGNVTLSENLRNDLDTILTLTKNAKEHRNQAENIETNLLPEVYNRLSPVFGSALSGILKIKGTDSYYYVERDLFEGHCSLDLDALKNEFPDTVKRYSNKVIKSTVFESKIEKLKNGLLTVEEFVAEMENVEDTFDKDSFYADNRKCSKLVAPYSKFYRRKVATAKDTNKIPNKFKVTLKDFNAPKLKCM